MEEVIFSSSGQVKVKRESEVAVRRGKEIAFVSGDCGSKGGSPPLCNAIAGGGGQQAEDNCVIIIKAFVIRRMLYATHLQYC